MSFNPTYNPDHFLEVDDGAPVEDPCDVRSMAAWTCGRMWQRLQTTTIVRSVIPSVGTEMVMRMAEAKGLPFSAEYLSDTFMLVTIGDLAAH